MRHGLEPVLWISLLLIAAVARAQGPADMQIITDDVRKEFATELKQNQLLAKTNKDLFARQGILANRKTRELELLAFATGLAKDAPAEFLLVGPGGKDYESYAVTIAKPSEIHAALEFIGMKPGRPVDNRAFQFWPKGERVDILYEFKHDGKQVKLPPSDLILDGRTGKPLPNMGWVFVGSRKEKKDGKELYLADNVGDIITDFNSPWTVFDIPYQADQGGVYGSLVANPKYLVKVGTRIRVRIKPQLPANQKRVVAYDVLVKGGDKGLQITVTNEKNTKVLEAGSFKGFLDLLMGQVKKKKDIFTRFTFGDQVAIGPLVELCAMINQLIQKKVIRIEANPKQLYYQSFLPQKNWREPKNRMVQPIELHLKTGGDRHTFRYYDEDLLPDGETKLKKVEYQFAGSAELYKVIASREEWDARTVLFFVPKDMPHLLVLKFYLEQRKRFPVAYVFVE